MAFTTKLLSLFSKEAAARSIFRRVHGMIDTSIVTRDTGRKGLELRGKYSSRPACVRICMVWGSAWLTVKPKEELDFRMVAHRDDDMDRRGYEKWKSAQDPEWDTGAGIEIRRYLSDHVYFESKNLSFDEDSDRWIELHRFEKIPSDLRQRIIAAVELDTHGKFAFYRDKLELGVAKRIFWVGDPLTRIQNRLELAAEVLDWMEGRRPEAEMQAAPSG